MKRQFILFLMTLISLISYAYDFEVDGIYYNRNYDWSSSEPQYDGTVSVTKGNYSYSGDVIIPDVVTYDKVKYKVTCIESFFDMRYWSNDTFGSIKSIVIGNNIKEIPAYCFTNCDNLTTVILSEGVTSIGDQAFADCHQLINISLPNTIKRIGNAVFMNCTGLSSIEIPSSVEIMGTECFDGCNNLCNVILPDNMTEIPLSTFLGCKGLKKIILPQSLNSIGFQAFHNSGLESIDIPMSVKKIDASAFAFTNIKQIEIHDDIESIGSSAFMYCYNLSSVKLPKSLKKIPSGLFYCCKALSFISIPNTVEKIESGAFQESGLVSVTIPDLVDNISENAFAYCNNLISVIIPKSVKTIYSAAFADCALNDITINAITPPTTYDDSFTTFNATLYVPEGKISDYKNAKNWKKFKNIQEINGTTQKYFISAKYDYGGSVELNEEAIISGNVKDFSEGSKVIIKITPLENYIIRSVVLSGEDITDKLNDNEYTIENINKDLSLVVSFKELRDNYNVSLSQEAKNGTITVNDEVLSRYTSIPVQTGSDATLKIIPDPGYDIATVTVNGESILGELKDGVYVIKAIDDDCVIYVVFTEKLKHQFLTVTHNDPGKVFLNGSEIPYNKTWGFPKGSNVSLKVVPDDGFRLKYASIIIGWGSPNEITYDINEDGEYTIEEIKDNYSVYVEFESNPYYIHIIGASGSVISIPVRGGERQEVRLPVQSNRKVSKVTYNGEDITSQIRKDGTFFTPIINEDVSMEIMYEGERPAGDVNNDGVVDAADVVQIVNIIMGEQ